MSAKYGTFKKLTSIVFKTDNWLVSLIPHQDTTFTADRQIQLPPGDADKILLDQSLTGVKGTLGIANGGTGQITQQAAINSLVGGAGTSGKVLRSDGTNVSMASIQAGDVPTLNQNTTGTASNVTGTVAIVNGGTGQTTAANAINALLPSQTGNSGKYLTSNGSVASWGNVTQSGVQAISSITGATTITPSNTATVYLCNSASAFTLGIATAVGIDGYALNIKNIGAGVVTVDPNASETIDGALTVSLSKYASITLVANGGNWYII